MKTVLQETSDSSVRFLLAEIASLRIRIAGVSGWGPVAWMASGSSDAVESRESGTRRGRPRAAQQSHCSDE